MNIEIFSVVSSADINNFTKHMAVMLKSGINIYEVIDSLAGQTKSGKFRKTLNQVKIDIKNGLSLSKALAKFPKIFDSFYLSIVEVGEESGTLDKSLSYLATKLQKESELRKKVNEALLYPKIVIGLAIVIAIGISLFVLPKLGDMFSSFNIELPFATRILLGFAEFMKKYNIAVVVGIIALVVLAKIFVSLSFIRPIWARFVMIIPGFGQFLIAAETASFCRNLGVMLSSGLSISRALEILSQTTKNDVFKGYIMKLRKSVAEGKTLSEELIIIKYSKIPDMVTKMVSVGEKSGGLNDMLMYLGDNYELEADSLAKNLSSLIEPVLLIIIAGMVALIALAVILPIYQLTGSIGR